MNVRDLYNIYESINRDIAKLKTTRSSIPVDREYTSVLQNTITSEIEKFESLKKLIQELEVEIPETERRLYRPFLFSNGIIFSLIYLIRNAKRKILFYLDKHIFREASLRDSYLLHYFFCLHLVTVRRGISTNYLHWWDNRSHELGFF